MGITAGKGGRDEEKMPGSEEEAGSHLPTQMIPGEWFQNTWMLLGGEWCIARRNLTVLL